MKSLESITRKDAMEPAVSKFFIQIDRREEYNVRRGYMNIPSEIREELERRGWKNKDRVWVFVGEKGNWFVVFHTYDDFLKFKKLIEKCRNILMENKRLKK